MYYSMLVSMLFKMWLNFPNVAIFPNNNHRDSGSDIETIEESNNKTVEGESNLESLNSDGIPVGEELNESGEAQYLWSSECSGITQVSPDEEDHEVDDDDMEIVDKSETKLVTSGKFRAKLFMLMPVTMKHFKESLKSNL